MLEDLCSFLFCLPALSCLAAVFWLPVAYSLLSGGSSSLWSHWPVFLIVFLLLPFLRGVICGSGLLVSDFSTRNLYLGGWKISGVFRVDIRAQDGTAPGDRLISAMGLVLVSSSKAFPFLFSVLEFSIFTISRTCLVIFFYPQHISWLHVSHFTIRLCRHCKMFCLTFIWNSSLQVAARTMATYGASTGRRARRGKCGSWTLRHLTEEDSLVR